MGGIDFAFQWELGLMEALQRGMGPLLTKIASLFSVCGEEMLMIALLGFLYWSYDKEWAKYIGTNVMVGTVLNPMVKNIVLRRRPYFDHPEIKCLKPVDPDADVMDITAQGYSFPSGHSLNSAVMYGSLPRGRGKKGFWVLAFVLPFLVGISRFMLGVHYPTDVFAGWILGAAIVIGIGYLQRKVKRRSILHLVIFLVSLTGVIWCRTSDYYTGLGMMAGMFLAFPFEERFVKFENTRVLWKMILRVLGGFAVYFGLNTALKLPFSSEFLSSGSMASMLVRTVRYAVVVFVMIGVYPMLFRVFRKKDGEAAQKKAA